MRLKMMALRLAAVGIGLSLSSGSAAAADPGQDAVVSRDFLAGDLPTPSCHASTIAEPVPGTFIAAWFGGTAEGQPDVGIWTSRWVDGKWSAPVAVADGVQPDGKRWPCWNPVLFQKPGGELLLFYKVGPSPMTWWGLIRISTDGGMTWSEPTRLSRDGTAIHGGPVGPIKNKPVALGRDVLLAPSSTETEKGWRAHFERSSDGGATWNVIGPVNDGRAIGAIQPSVLDLGSGKLLALGRTRESKRIFQIESANGGLTWGEMTLTDMPNPNSGTDAVTLREAIEDVLWHAVARPDLRARQPLPGRRGQRALDDPILDLHHGGRLFGAAVHYALDQPQRHEALLLEPLDELQAIDELLRVPRHVA